MSRPEFLRRCALAPPGCVPEVADRRFAVDLVYRAVDGSLHSFRRVYRPAGRFRDPAKAMRKCAAMAAKFRRWLAESRTHERAAA